MALVKVHFNTEANRILTKEYNEKRDIDPSSVLPVAHCDKHRNNEFRYFCKTCQVPICSECTVMEHPNKSHSYDYLQTIADRYKDDLLKYLKRFEVKAEEVDKCKTAAMKICNEYIRKPETEQKKVLKKSTDLRSRLSFEENALKAEVKREYDIRIQTQNDQIHDLQFRYCRLISMMNYLEYLVQHKNAAQLMLTKESVVNCVQELEGVENKYDIDHDEVKFVPAVTTEPLLGTLVSVQNGSNDSYSEYDINDKATLTTNETTVDPEPLGIGGELTNYKISRAVDLPDSVRERIGNSFLICTLKQQTVVVYERKYKEVLFVDKLRTNSVTELEKVARKAKTDHKTLNSEEDALIGQLEKIYSVKVKEITSHTDELQIRYGKFCTVDTIPHRLIKGQSVDFVITTKDRRGEVVNTKQKVKVTLTSADGSCKDVKVTENGNGTHTVTVHGEMVGDYKVSISVSGQAIPGSPFDFRVLIPLVKTFGGPGHEKGYFNNPTGLAFDSNGNLVVADHSNKEFRSLIEMATSRRFSHLPNGKLIRSFGEAELRHPRGIAISPLNGVVYVTDWDGEGNDTDRDGHCIRKYTQTGEYINSFGSYGQNEGQFRGPHSIDFDSDGNLYVSDFNNSRVQVFDENDRFVRAFGSFGEKEGHFKRPSGIVVSQDKLVYVVDQYANNIQAFDVHGKFIHRIDSGEDKLDHPMGIAQSRDDPRKLFVADNLNHCIKVFID
ncbi:tripartite motif-containing protein 2-like [Ptychodera flava]|uniref:tripartite motif-containing protein 2-like n=1 Tax=Ptychodera flava TaxID=63121 RepID=UPI00396A656E